MRGPHRREGKGRREAPVSAERHSNRKKVPFPAPHARRFWASLCAFRFCRARAQRAHPAYRQPVLPPALSVERVAGRPESATFAPFFDKPLVRGVLPPKFFLPVRFGQETRTPAEAHIEDGRQRPSPGLGIEAHGKRCGRCEEQRHPRFTKITPKSPLTRNQ
jgi:hypothetical protein